MNENDTVPRSQYEALLAAAYAAPGRGRNLTPAQIERAREVEAGRVDALVAERQRETARLQAAREQAAVDEGRQRLATFEGQSRQRFLNNGASEVDFQRAWPSMKQAWLTEQSASDPHEQLVESLVERMRAEGAGRM